MDEPICALCGEPITESQGDAGNYVSTAFGEWHLDCIDEYERDRDARAADYYHDSRYDT